MTPRNVQPCRLCGEPILLMIVIPGRIQPGTKRKRVPLNLMFDPDGPTPASHAMSPGRTTCHPITRDYPLEGHETPALTHFATCPALHRSPVSTATEGTA